MKKLGQLLSGFFGVLLLCSLLSAQQSAQSNASTSTAIVPRLVNYSGKAVDAQGKAVAGTAGVTFAGVTFAIYAEESGGAPLWLETQSVRVDARGNYSAQLGATTAEGLPLELFSTGSARWLGVRVNGGDEQPRALLLSVPYALKAADAETVGGLPASAFVLAGTSSGAGNAVSAASSAATAAATPTTSLTGSGTADYLPLWTSSSALGSSVLFQSGTGKTAKIGIGTITPAATLDVSGGATIRGLLNLPAAATATAAGGADSRPFGLVASTFNSSSQTASNQVFHWQAEPVANNTASPSATLNLLFSTAPAAGAETGLSINSGGQISFAPGQTFPGTATSVGLSAPSSDFTVTNSPVTSNGTLTLNWTVAPTNAATPNAIVKRDSNGSFFTGPMTATSGDGTSAITGSSSGGGIGVSGSSPAGYGLSGKGVYGLSANGTQFGVYSVGGLFGVYGSGTTYGLWGANSPTGVRGDGSSYGVYGTASGAGSGVYGSNSAGIGVYGFSTSSSSYGVYGYNPNGGVGAAGISTDNAGVYGQSGSGGWAVDAYNSANGTGVLAGSSAGYAGWFNGDVEVDGNLSKAGGSFKIDHPLDPANKYLYHSFVESPDMMNIYNGNVTTDASGDAVVAMPDWFESLNRDYRYQLTVIGQFAQAIVSSEIANGRFSIKTDKPNVKVSWQVTGVRQDAWANAHRIPVEQVKPEAERGFYLHPELFGAPDEKGVLWARSPQAMQRWKEARAKDAAQKTSEVLSKP
jgi:hypothetical protein